MYDRDYERMARRRRTQRKSTIATIAAAAVIMIAIAAIVIAVVAVADKNRAETPQETVAPTAQPTLYHEETQPSSAAQPTEATTSAQQWYQQPTSQYEYPTQPAAYPTSAYDVTEQGGSSGAADGALHYYAYGKTSYGYDWTYSGGGGIVSVGCSYDFSLGRYDFTVTGVSPGVTSLTLIYNTGDDQTVSVPMTVTVDSALNVTQN